MRRETSPFRHRETPDAGPFALVALAGIVTILIGLWLLQDSTVVFGLEGAVAGIVSQVPTTLPAVVAVGLAMVLEIAAGAVLVRLVRWSPYGSLSEAITFGLVGAVAKDTVLLLALGSVGHFRPLALVVVDLALVAGLFLLRPFIERAPTSDPAATARLPSVAWVLPVIVWSIPVWVALASPVVPFVDVLPNHVAPVQHVEAFGSWDRLAVAPSPIYGSSRILVGYVALLASVTSLTSLPATLVTAAFAVPLAVLLAAGSYHLCRSIGGRAAGYWSLLLVPLTFTFLRVPDARATVLAFPVAAAALALTLPEPLDRIRPTALAGRSRPVLLAASLGAAMLVHPVIGGFAAATVAVLGLARSATLRRGVMAGVVGAAVVAAPQAMNMFGIDLPAWVGIPAWPLGVLVAAGLAGPGPRRGDVSEALDPAPSVGLGWLVLGAVVVASLAVGGAAVVLQVDPQATEKLRATVANTVADYPVLLLGSALAVIFVRDLRGWLVIGTGLAVALGAMLVANLAPGETLLGQSLRFELPKSVGYWAPWLVALAGGLGLGALWSRDAWPGALRGGVAAVVIVLAAAPMRIEGLERAGIEEHRYAESAAIALDVAEHGYWAGYPDRRKLIDTDGQALADAVVAERRAGRIGPRTRVLHIAPSFQQWVATPLGVWTGVLETTATRDPEHSVHTVGGHLRGLDEVDRLPGDYAYVVVEGFPVSDGYDASVEAAGFERISRGEDWRLYRLRA